MKYAVNLDKDGRVSSVTFAEYASANAVLVDALPEGDVCDYRYEDGAFVYDPVEKPDTPPSQREKIAALEKTVEEQQALIDAFLGG